MASQSSPKRKLSVRDRVHARGRTFAGFTLIEVLVVVAIIALLLAILLPSLSRARQQAQLTICLAHMKEFANAMAMYTEAHKGTLPGPCHPGIFQEVSESGLPIEGYLPWLVRRYFGGSGRGSETMTDELATCPSFPVPDKVFNDLDIPVFQYVLNTYTHTHPDYYFSFAHGGQGIIGPDGLCHMNWTAWETWRDDRIDLGQQVDVEKISVIKRPTAEWVIADAFATSGLYGSKPDLILGADNATNNPRLRGSWPILTEYPANSGNPLPKSPFHLGGGVKEQAAPGGGGTIKAYGGRTSTLYFDWHAEAQRGWRGTTQPD